MGKYIKFDRIVRDPEICHGQVTIKGTRILVVDILELIKQGESFDSILEGFPSLKVEDIQEIISYAEALITGESILYGSEKDKILA